MRHAQSKLKSITQTTHSPSTQNAACLRRGGDGALAHRARPVSTFCKEGWFLSSLRQCVRRIAVAALTLVLASVPLLSSANAQSKLEAQFTASIAGIPLGRGVWTIDVTGDHYTASASGKTVGLVQMFSSGQGSVAASGTVNGGKPVSATYAANVVTEKKTDQVQMALNAGAVKDYSALPVWPPTPDRVPVTEAHRRGVVDPMSAALMPVSGTGDPVKPEACNRTLAIFDGRGRFDLTLSYKRMERVKTDKGYQGPVVVCMVRYRPIAGHRPNRWAIKFLTETRDIEVAMAPIGPTRVLAPYRVSIPTSLGTALLEATQFVAVPNAARATPASTSARTF
jgi:hypothetical protein